MKVTAIVPAYNEARRIAAVLTPLKACGAVDEIVVVSDGSTDGTYDLVKRDPDVTAIRLEHNRGKGGAMAVGARMTDADALLFLDADLRGLTPDHIRSLVGPVASGGVCMSLGVFHGGRFLTDLAQRIVPCISGQRCVTREFFLSIPALEDARMGVETAITCHALRAGIPIARVVLKGVTHPMKEEKLGPLRGAASRAQMYCDIFRWLLVGPKT